MAVPNRKRIGKKKRNDQKTKIFGNELLLKRPREDEYSGLTGRKTLT